MRKNCPFCGGDELDIRVEWRSRYMVECLNAGCRARGPIAYAGALDAECLWEERHKLPVLDRIDNSWNGSYARNRYRDQNRHRHKPR